MLNPGERTAPNPGYFLRIDLLVIIEAKVERILLYILASLNGIFKSSRLWLLVRLNLLFIWFTIDSAKPACPLAVLILLIIVLPIISYKASLVWSVGFYW